MGFSREARFSRKHPVRRLGEEPAEWFSWRARAWPLTIRPAINCNQTSLNRRKVFLAQPTKGRPLFPCKFSPACTSIYFGSELSIDLN